MNNMMTRALSGTVYVALIVACTLGGFIYFTALMALFAILGVNELEKLLGTNGRLPGAVRILDSLMSLLVFVLMASLNMAYDFMSSWIPATALSGIVVWLPLRLVMAVMSRDGTSARDFAVSVFAVVYVTAPLAVMSLTYAGGFTAMVMFIMLWLNDTGAYLTGRSFGRRKLCERLSPKKTWEGFWGGFALCVAAGAVTGWLYYPTAAGVMLLAVYGAAVSVMGTVGDLFESLLKRTMGVKDSGNLIPGHGGILDRIDSLLGAAMLTVFFNFIIFKIL